MLHKLLSININIKIEFIYIINIKFNKHIVYYIFFIYIKN